MLVEVLNTGVAIADDVTVEISYRSSGSRRWIPIPCATNCSVSQFEPGSRFITNADLFLLTLTPGSYEVRAVVDPNNEIAELDEFNNEIQSTFKLLAIQKPDLLIDPISVQFLPSLAERQGTPITISADVVNFGEADADAFDVTISLQQISGDTIGSPITVANIALDGLDIGGRFTIESTINTNLEPGFYQINIEVDPQDRIMELDELNNLFITGPLFIRGPDLTGFMRLINPASTGTIPQIGAGTDVEVAVDVTNIGIEAAGEFSVDFCIQPVDANGLETGTCMPFGTPQTFSGIGIASSLEATAILNTSGLASGRYNVKALIDSNNQVREENELNNQAIVTIDIVGGSTSNAGGPVTGVDLVIEKIDLNPPVAAIGQLVDVKARLVNIGTQNAGPFRAVFFYKRKGQTLMTNFHQTQITTLPAGQMIWLQASLSTSLLGLGEFEIIVIADFNNEISEPNEFNNRLSMDLEIF